MFICTRKCVFFRKRDHFFFWFILIEKTALQFLLFIFSFFLSFFLCFILYGSEKQWDPCLLTRDGKISHLSKSKYVLSHTPVSLQEIKRPKDGADNDLGREGGQIWVANSGWTGWRCEHSWKCLSQTAYLHMSCIVFWCLWLSALTHSLLVAFESTHMSDICLRQSLQFSLIRRLFTISFPFLKILSRLGFKTWIKCIVFWKYSVFSRDICLCQGLQFSLLRRLFSSLFYFLARFRFNTLSNNIVFWKYIVFFLNLTGQGLLKSTWDNLDPFKERQISSLV